MTDFTAISIAMDLCHQRESTLRSRAADPRTSPATAIDLQAEAELASAARSHLQHLRAIRTCHWTEDSDGQLHAHGQIWNPGDYVFCPTCGRQTAISKPLPPAGDGW